MDVMKIYRLWSAAAAAGLMLGGCAEITDAWNRIARALTPAEQAVQEAEEREPPEAKPSEISALINFSTAAGLAESHHPAVEYIESLGDEVMAAIADTSITEAERIKFFGALLARDLDIPLIARFTLGRHWSKATREQRRTYVAVFADFVVQTYSSRLGGLKVGHFEVLKAQKVGKKDIVVRSRIAQTYAKPIRADWRMRHRDGRYRILDLSVEGISMALVLRQEFASVLRAKGGVDGLIAALREKLI